MTRDEFLESLRKRQEVRFDQARIFIDNHPISPAVAQHLGDVLGPNEQVRYGLQSGRLSRAANSDIWTGTIIWWLTTSRAVLYVKIHGSATPRAEVTVECRRYPTHMLGRCDLTATITPDSTRYTLILRWEGEPPEPLESTTFQEHCGADALRLFAASVLHDA